jgi:hypothetical protein
MDRGGHRAAPASARGPAPVAAGGPTSPWPLRAALGLGAVLLLLLPRVWAYPALLEQNLELKQRLQEVEGRMDEADRILGRLRLYDAQLRSLTTQGGQGGPIASDDEELGGFYDDLTEDVREGAASLSAGGDLPPDGPLDADELRPAEQWAAELAGRVTDFVDLFEMSEAELAALMADLETLNAIHQSLPSRWPADGILSSGFGWRRDPFTRSPKWHAGLDIANSVGTPVFAVADGTVVRSEYSQGYGNMVELDHGFGIHTRYGHFSRRKVDVGQRVERGDLVGMMGSTGRSTGPHVHFEVRIDGSAHDPLRYLPR